MLKMMFLSQASTQPFTDLLSLNSTPSSGASLLVDVFSDSSTSAPVDVCEENFSRWDHTVSLVDGISRKMKVTAICIVTHTVE